jgi:tetratricopeptide (TPR) repeat protein
VTEHRHSLFSQPPAPRPIPPYRAAAPPPELAAPIAAFEARIDAGDRDGAYTFFREHLDRPTLYGVGPACFQRIPLLERFFGAGLHRPPMLSSAAAQLYVLHQLGIVCNLIAGRPRDAVRMYRMHHAIAHAAHDTAALSECMGDHAKSLRQSGSFRESEAVAREGLRIQRQLGDLRREAVNLYWVGMGLAHRGADADSAIALGRSLRIFQEAFATQSEGVVNAFLAQRALWTGDAETARVCAGKTWAIAERLEADPDHPDQNGVMKISTAAARMIGEAHMLRGEREAAERWIAESLRRAALIHMVEEMLPAWRVLAQLAHAAGDHETARAYIARTVEVGEPGHYTLYLTDSYNAAARIACDEGDRAGARAAAVRAYRMAWCDGPPFAYQRGLDDAAHLLDRLGAPHPVMPVYSPLAWPPLPDVALDPPEHGSG